MNTDASESSLRTAEAQAAQQFARLLLEGQETRLTPAIGDRLRNARAHAVARMRGPRTQVAPVLAMRPAGLPDRSADASGWFVRFGAVASVVLLLAGLAALQHFQNERLVRSTADIDTALLLDDLPPAAYTDPGFTRFLQQQQS